MGASTTLIADILKKNILVHVEEDEDIDIFLTVRGVSRAARLYGESGTGNIILTLGIPDPEGQIKIPCHPYSGE